MTKLLHVPEHLVTDKEHCQVCLFYTHAHTHHYVSEHCVVTNSEEMALPVGHWGEVHIQQNQLGHAATKEQYPPSSCKLTHKHSLF